MTLISRWLIVVDFLPWNFVTTQQEWKSGESPPKSPKCIRNWNLLQGCTRLSQQTRWVTRSSETKCKKCFCLDLPKDLNANRTAGKLGWTLVAASPSGFWFFCWLFFFPSILMKFITVAFKLKLWFKFSKAGRTGLEAWYISVCASWEARQLQILPQGVPGWSPHPLDMLAVTQASGFLASPAALLLTAKQPHIQTCHYVPWRYLQFTF